MDLGKLWHVGKSNFSRPWYVIWLGGSVDDDEIAFGAWIRVKNTSACFIKCEPIFFLVKINCFPWTSSLKFNFLSSIVNEFDLGERLSGNHGVYQYGVSLQFFRVTPYELMDRHIFPTCSGGIWHFIDSIQMFPSRNQAFVVSLKVG